MTPAIILKLLHVLAAFGLVTGIVGRNVTFTRARVATTLDSAYALLQVSSFFEKWMVIPVSTAVLVLGLITAWLQKWPILGFLQGGSSNWVLASLVVYILPSALIVPALARRRRLRERTVEDAHALGRITPEMTSALNDSLVVRLRTAELVVIILVIVIMVTKPF